MAKERGLTYVKLDGNVGILGNGAGLVMSTLDVVAQAGGKPANFLDAGGGSKAEAITSAVEVILSDDKVSAVLFNIFGGITRCDEVAKGLIEAFEQIEPDVPFVVRLDGTNDKEGRALLAEADLPNVHTEATMLGAAEKVVELAELMAILVDKDTRLVRLRHHGPRGHLPQPAQPRLRHQRRGRRDARQGRPGRGRRAGLRHLPRRGRRDRRQHRDGLRAAALRRRLDPRGRGRRHRADHRDHRGHPGARRAARLQPPAARQLAAGRAQLPGHPLARQGERGDHPGAVLQGGQRRARVALRHADLPDRQRAGPARLRQLVDRRHRRRPRAGLELHRHASSCSRPTPRPS